ncbi:MAG TPA: adenylyl-sulfate kinase [Flavobacteriales bacterium]|nr:adenylyl-sulfate kinase [Flavobacteriales bacterium]
MENIHPDFDKFASRKTKEALLNQKGMVIWFTGLSGSGKSTIAAGLDRLLVKKGYVTAVLDGDNVRTGINNNLGFSDEDRNENIRRIAEVAKLMVANGLITLCCFVSPLNAQRKLARSIIGKNDFIEVYVNTPLEVCEQRDVKGLYAKARKGLINDFTGVNAPFEIPDNADCILETKGKSVEQSVDEMFAYVLAHSSVNKIIS